MCIAAIRAKITAIRTDLEAFYNPQPPWTPTPDPVLQPNQSKPPEFAAASNVVLGTFSVIIGIAIQDFLDPKVEKQFGAIYWFAFIMMITAALRYLVGSAVHFTYTYGARTGGPRCGSPGLFFKDLIFVVLFGVLAVGVTQAPEFGHFTRRLMWFLALGAAWSITDTAIRYRWGLPAEPDREVQLWHIWLFVDLTQLLVTQACVWLFGYSLAAAVALAAIYVGALFIDVLTLTRWLQRR